MDKDFQMLYDLINGFKEDMKVFSKQLNETREGFIRELNETRESFTKELNETRTLISKYNGLREQIGERDELINKLEKTIKRLEEKVDLLESKIDCIDNTSKGKRQAFEYVRKWTPWVITVLTVIYAFLRLNG